jgi:hypothetical protein
MKAIGKLDEGKLHVQFDVAGNGNGVNTTVSRPKKSLQVNE